jgi:RNA polymerase sigma factor (sigma-70 family)
MSGDLVKRIRERPSSEPRWEEWYKSVYPRLYYAAFRLANGSAELARDLTQEAFTRFLEYRAIERVENEQHALAYLIKTCRNVAIDRNVRAEQTPLDDLINVDSIPAPEQQSEAVVDLEHVFDELTAEDRALLGWIRDGHSISEIARKLDLSYTAAGVRVHRLKKRLRTALGV